MTTTAEVLRAAPDDDVHELRSTAYRVRQHCIRMSASGGCFLGAALSCADVLTYLYFRELDVAPETFAGNDRDYFLLSKGHAVPALYGVLAERGFIERARLARHLDIGDSVYWHPNRSIPGVDFHSGSLGHALSIGVGIALDLKLRRSARKVVVLLGDGELNEGSIWEALLVAAAHKLGNLIVVVDRNRLQANVATEHLVPLEPLADKFRSFGLRVADADGHSFRDLGRAFAEVAADGSAPAAIIARTVRGKGIASHEGRLDRWFVATSPKERDELLAELDIATSSRTPAAEWTVSP